MVDFGRVHQKNSGFTTKSMGEHSTISAKTFQSKLQDLYRRSSSSPCFSPAFFHHQSMFILPNHAVIFFQAFSVVMIEVPALRLYDSARSDIAKGLCAGGLRLLWSQFPTGRMEPMDYGAFRQVFGRVVGWRKYKPWSPPTDARLCSICPEVKNKKQRSLSYSYSFSTKVKILIHILLKLNCVLDTLQRGEISWRGQSSSRMV